MVAKERFGYEAPDLAQLVHWANIIDGAQYADAKSAVELGSPAMKLTLVIEGAKGSGIVQKIIGWILVVVSVAYIAYFLKVRLFTPGPIIEKKEWVQFIGSFITLMLGTINVRMAAMRARQRKGLPN